MKFNKEEMKRLGTLPDRELWESLKGIAHSHGYSLPEKMPASADMEKLRRALVGIDKINLTEAAKILQGYKKNKMILWR